MNITRELLDKIAHLARLEIKEDEAEQLMHDMSEIITWVEKLNEVDTTGVEPLTTMSHELNNVREDIPQPHLPHEDALRNAPQKDQAFFKVPKVVE